MKVYIPMIDSDLEMDADSRGAFVPIFFFKDDELHSHLALQQWRLHLHCEGQKKKLTRVSYPDGWLQLLG